MSEVKAGNVTSEYKVMILTMIASLVTTLSGLVEQWAATSDNPWAGVVLAGVGVVMATLTALGYIKGRSTVKAAASDTGGK